MTRPCLGLAAAVLAGGVNVAAGAAAPANGALPVANAGFEQPASAARIPGWTISQHAGVQAFDMRVDTRSAAEGHASFRIERVRAQVYGVITQTLDAAGAGGKTLELTAKVKTADVGPEGWVLYIDSAGTRVTNKATGTGNWRTLKVRLKLPAGARKVEIGAMLLDRGTAWLDDVQLHAVER